MCPIGVNVSYYAGDEEDIAISIRLNTPFSRDQFTIARLYGNKFNIEAEYGVFDKIVAMLKRHPQFVVHY